MNSPDLTSEALIARWDLLLKAGENEEVERQARAVLLLVLPIGGMAKRGILRSSSCLRVYRKTLAASRPYAAATYY